MQSIMLILTLESLYNIGKANCTKATNSMPNWKKLNRYRIILKVINSFPSNIAPYHNSMLLCNWYEPWSRKKSSSSRTIKIIKRLIVLLQFNIKLSLNCQKCKSTLKIDLRTLESFWNVQSAHSLVDISRMIY